MKKLKILLVEDEIDALEALVIGLENDEWQIETATSVKQAVSAINSVKPNIVVTDLKLKDGSGQEILAFIRENQPDLPVIVVTAFGSIDSAIQAIRSGAYDYLQKPIKIAELKRAIERLSENIELRRENEQLKRQLSTGSEFVEMIGVSSQYRKMLEMVKQIAPAKSTVLITGESGTGKEVVAEAIHSNSPRSKKQLITINCGAIPENLVESELFGYEKGAFTGAQKAKKGKIEVADGGTLFLDEVGDLPRPMQVKLLRVIQKGELERVGATSVFKVDIRIIAATNVDLQQKIDDGEFREDLFYRLNVIGIEVPPLRERQEDIPLLAQHFIERFNRINSKKVESISTKVLNAMRHHRWKGNIRELENMVERAVVLAQEPVLNIHLFPTLATDYEESAEQINSRVGMTMAEIEREAIEQTLRHHNFDKNMAAKSLHLSLATLYRKIKEYDIIER